MIVCQNGTTCDQTGWSCTPPLISHGFLIRAFITILLLTATTAIILAYRTFHILRSIHAGPARSTEDSNNQLLIVLGSGGHTAEMISILHTLGLEYIVSRFCGPDGKRTWVISEGDNFSAIRAQDFENEIKEQAQGRAIGTYDIVVVPRARRIHQSLWSTPISALWCLWSCVLLLKGRHTNQRVASSRYPDLILTNGPGTAVIVVLASLMLKFVGLAPLEDMKAMNGKQVGLMRTIYVESWARVKTLSLSGKILRFMVGRFLIQWKGMQDIDLTLKKAKHVETRSIHTNRSLKSTIEYVGTVVT